MPYGLGRSYGDSCINSSGKIFSTYGLSRIISFDQQTGLLHAEAGLNLYDLIRVFLPKGWFLPVSPGTQFVTLGGAIANDIHGKNHHCAGTFGCFIDELELLRSNGEVLTCSMNENTDLFKATIGGLGLTGLVLTCKVRLKPVKGPLINQEVIKFQNLTEFYEISKDSADYEYTVAWLDCVSTGDNFGRGHFIRGNHSKTTQSLHKYFKKSLPLKVPFNLPGFTLNKYSIKAFNALYYNKQFSKNVSSQVNFEPFFYPLDAVKNWNRIYGKRGFLQFQCVIPEKNTETMNNILQKVVDSGKASFLAVFKVFGDIQSPGMLSFPRPGATLCLDFPNDRRSRNLLIELDQIVAEFDGASYPAKDALMAGSSFKKYYPAWETFAREYKDPLFSSNFWERVTN